MVSQTKVFVGSLPQGSNPEDLRNLFESFGTVTECDIISRCGFVHMETEDQAAAAIKGLQNTTFNGAVITVERGRIKERGQRNGGGPRGGMRNGMDRRPGGPMRHHYMGVRDAPYMRDSRHMSGMRSDMREPPMGGGGMGMRNGMGGGGGGYDRGMDRGMGGYPEDRYGSYGGDDRRGFGGGLLDSRGGRGDPYGSPGADYADERRGYGDGPIDDLPGMYPNDRRGPLYPDERDLMDRRGGAMRGGPMSLNGGYDRSAPSRAASIGNGGEMFSRRPSPPMRGVGGGGGYDRDMYSQQYNPMGRVNGGAVPHGGRDLGGGMGPRRY